jgi:hypothetical protein
MDTSFTDRLARIGAQNSVAVDPNVQLVGSSVKRPALNEAHPVRAPKTYDQPFRSTIINNIIMGFFWMAVTGFIAVNFNGAVTFLAGSDPTASSITNITWGVGVALVLSTGLFYWVTREAIRDLGKLHGMPILLAIDSCIGTVVDVGRTAIFHYAVDYGVLQF